MSTKTLKRRRQRQQQRQRQLSAELDKQSVPCGPPPPPPPPSCLSAGRRINKNIDLCVVWVPEENEEGLVIPGHWKQVVVLDEEDWWDDGDL